MSDKKFLVHDESWGQDLEKGAEAYTDMLFEAVWSTDDGEVTETLSGQPFCGCSTCFWRETLFYLVPKIIEGYEEGKVTIEK